MTVALTVNATGTQQLKPIIHTAQKPRAFPKNFKVESALECALVLQQDFREVSARKTHKDTDNFLSR
jgi:hypothetical protein